MRYYAADLIQSYHAHHPHITIQPVIGQSSEVIRLLQAKEIHLGFIRGDHLVDCEKYLYSTNYGYILSKDKIKMEDIPHLPRIEYRRDPLTIKRLKAWWYENFSEPPLAGPNVYSIDAGLDFISIGFGYGIFFLPSESIPEGLYKIPLHGKDGKILQNQTWMIYSKDYKSSLMIRNFAEHIKKNPDSLFI